MAKTKAELEFDATRFRHAVSLMRKTHQSGEVLAAIKVAVEACEYADGMMQFEKRFEKRLERKSVETIDYIFRFAPLVFDRASLERVGALLKEQKRIDKVATDDLASDLQQAFELMWDAHRLWKLLRETPGFPQDQLRTQLGGSQDRWRGISEAWEELGLIQRVASSNSYLLSPATQLSGQARGKCSACGATGKASMGAFLDNIICPKCKTKTAFVILISRNT